MYKTNNHSCLETCVCLAAACFAILNIKYAIEVGFPKSCKMDLPEYVAQWQVAGSGGGVDPDTQS